ncbi:MAG TPA: hypothetical protein VHB50_05360, partial [Bryobacteraceae bacterium]|nr:hypothetical protein [Bryobacteraceae bacterium]
MKEIESMNTLSAETRTETEQAGTAVVARDDRSPWRNGEWVEVKSAPEIARTLDADGALDGLPFMPEMLGHCGRRYRVIRR